jgi:hypothetical protein
MTSESYLDDIRTLLRLRSKAPMPLEPYSDEIIALLRMALDITEIMLKAALNTIMLTLK